jgi:hypothetical protein
MSPKVLLPIGMMSCVALGFAVARWSSAAPPPANRAEAAMPAATVAMRPVTISTSGRVDEAALRGVVRDVLREELRSAQPAAAPAPPSPLPTAASVDAHDKGLELVQSARARRHWTSDDVAAMRHLLPQLTQEQREEVFHTLLPAFNRGEIAVDVHGLPF